MTIFLNHKTDTISPDTVIINGIAINSLNVTNATSTISVSQANRHIRLTTSPTTLQNGFTAGQMLPVHNSLSTSCVVVTPPTYYEGTNTKYTGFLVPAKGSATLMCISNTEYVILGQNITYLNPPDAPTSVVATAGNAQATVSFTAPVNTGGYTIISYTVTSSGGQTATGSSSPITVTGLAIGTNYTFTVTATSIIGTSVPSTASAAIAIQ